MSAHCIHVGSKVKIHVFSEKTCLLALHFTCINRKVGCLIWTHSLIQCGTYLRKSKGKEEKKEEEDTHFVVLGLLVFCLRACDLSLEILYSLIHCWLSIIEEVFFAGFFPLWVFPGYIVVVSVILFLSVILVLIVYQEYCKDILNLSIHT